MSNTLRKHLNSLSRAERELEYAKTANHDRPKWTWEGNEAALIEQCEQVSQEQTHGD